METLDLFPTQLFVFKNSKFDNPALIDVLKHLDNTEIKKTTTISILYDLRNHPEFAELFAWFHECLEEIRISQTYDCDAFKITNSWFNVALDGHHMYQNYHRHSMSYFSAVYYMSNGAPTVFEDPVIHRTQAQLEVLRTRFNPEFNIDAEAGKLVIFPSWMYHRSLPHLGDNDRYIISFNSLPVGKINHNLATDSRAFIKIDND